jgi:hypothetical protein
MWQPHMLLSLLTFALLARITEQKYKMAAVWAAAANYEL